MSVRRMSFRTKDGGTKTRWMVDVVFTLPDGRVRRERKVSPVQTKRGAEAYERELRHALLGGTYDKREEKEEPEKKPPEMPTFQTFAREFMSVYSATNNKPSEVKAKTGLLKNHLLPYFGKLRLDQIGRRHIEGFKAQQKAAGFSSKTINNQLACFRRVMSVAEEWEVIAQVPRVLWLKVPESSFDFLTFDEAERLIAAAEPAWRTMIIVALKTGLRSGELRALRWEDVDLVARRINVRRSVWKKEIGTPKSGKGRSVELGAGVTAALSAHRHLRGELVFCRPDGGGLSEDEIKHPLWRAFRRAGLRRLGWHALRHTFASHLVMKLVPLTAVQQLMGHSTITMTMRYAHLSPDVRMNAVSVLDEPSHGKMTAKSAEETDRCLTST